VVSEAVGATAGIDLTTFPEHSIRDAPLTVRVIKEAEALVAVMA
jgi:hypothetical protein